MCARTRVGGLGDSEGVCVCVLLNAKTHFRDLSPVW